MSSLRNVVRLVGRCARAHRRLCTVQGAVAGVSVSVEDERVQELLGRVNGMDMDVVFSPRKEPLVPPRYQLMTRDQLHKAHDEAVTEAKKLLEMTPVLPEREPRGETLRHDEELDGYLEHRMVFTNISMNKDNRDREVVVREPTGVLREATWEERDCMMQVYFPSLGRRMWLPHMLTEEGLLPVLEAGRYGDILDMACIQREPDSEDYIRVHRTVYDRIEVEGAYDSLRSTRHFGGLVWYLVQQEKIVGLVKDLVEKYMWSEGEALVELYLLCHPHCSLASSTDSTPGKKLEAFCRNYSLGQLLAQLPTCLDSETDTALATQSTP